MTENERIARAAGLEWPLTTKQWRTDPGAVATWLLPVLEARFMSFTIGYNDHKTCYATFEQHHAQAIEEGDLSPELIAKARLRGGLWELNAYPDTPIGSVTFYALTWHEAVIAAILATGEAG